MATTDGNGRVLGVLASLAKYKFNPAGIQRVGLQHLRDVTDGLIEISDPTNPFVFCMESSAVNTAAFMEENAANNRKQYSSVAQTTEDLYLHMSDKDYLDRFSQPAITKFSMMISKEDLLSKMLDDPVTGGKKITIPRNSEFTIADVTFSLQYPIDIKLLAYGGIQVVYDTSITSPLQTLTTNVIKIETRTGRDKLDYIFFDFDVYQFKVSSSSSAITTATGFSQNIQITDEFYYARVFYKDNSTASWLEILTTHSDQIYDPTTPTAVLKLVEKLLVVTIPQIYLNTNLIKGTLRIDVYETKGPINMIMDNYTPSSFSARWRNIDKSFDTPYTAVINTLASYVYSSIPAVGGAASLTYEQLRRRVITNSIGDRDLPITNVQLESALETRGYSVVKNIDVVTNRVFLATRQLPKPLDEKLITAGASSIETLVISIEKAITFAGVYNNGSRITLTPDLIYRNDSGIISIVPTANINALLSSGPDNIANNVTDNNYLYTPFHYVLDVTGSAFELRPYYLDKPEAQSVKFVDQNSTTNLQVNTESYEMTRTATGFKLTVVTKSNDTAKGIADNAMFAQLSFVPQYEEATAYLNAVFVGRTEDDERIFEFNFSSNFDIDVKDNLSLTKFKLINTEDRITRTPLVFDFDLTYSTTADMPIAWIPSAIESKLGKIILPDNIVGITAEKIKILFGYSLKTLWARSRSVVSASIYQKYTEDIPWLYDRDVYLTDPGTGSIFSFDSYGELSYTIIHRLGDPILDINGLPTYRYRVGDVVLDNLGNPVPTSEAKVTRQLDMMFIEGSYYFATDSAAAKYRETIVDTVLSWLTVELKTLGGNLIEQTRLFYYPKTTMGSIKVLADEGEISVVEAGQYFVLDLFVTETVYADDKLRQSLKRSAISTIDDVLKKSTVSTSEIISLLKEKFSNDVISFRLSGLGGVANLAALTVFNNGERLNIRKRLVRLPDDKLIVEEDVTINFSKHVVKT